jgi:putative hydrolases of HD superfamily
VSDTDALRDRLSAALALKALPRAGWVRAGVRHPESVAAHSWGVAWLVLVLCPPALDRGRALAIAVVHDLPEVTVGDITPHDGVSAGDKAAAEAAAMTIQVEGLPDAAGLLALWHEYEHASTAEGRFVKACDKLDMALQAHLYASTQALDPDEFVRSALSRLEPGLLATLAGS